MGWRDTQPLLALSWTPSSPPAASTGEESREPFVAGATSSKVCAVPIGTVIAPLSRNVRDLLPITALPLKVHNSC